MFLLNDQDTELLRGYINALNELADGKRPPKTEQQAHFVQVVNGISKPKSNYEHAYLRFVAMTPEKQQKFIEKFGHSKRKKAVTTTKRKKRTQKKLNSREQHIHEMHRISGFYNIRASFVRG